MRCKDVHYRLFSWISDAEEFSKPAKVVLRRRPSLIANLSVVFVPGVALRVQINIGKLGRYDRGKYSLRNYPRFMQPDRYV